MQQVEILSIPNYYSSYYLLGFSKVFKLRYTPNKEFEKFNNRGFLIFKLGNKIGVIDNHDPVGVNQELYDQSTLYFATNKLLDQESYNQPKVRPLFPHYPVNILSLYLGMFGLDLILKLTPRDLAREIYVLRSRPHYREEKDRYHFGNYVFFSGSTWKKEPWANQIRADFIKACKAHPQIEFEGGFIPRSDGDNFGFDSELNKVKYSPKKFSELSGKSLISLNNPAVLGAVSWRLAEYWNFSSFVLSFPFAIDLPVRPEHGSHVHYIDHSEEYTAVIDKVFTDPDYHRQVARGGKAFFNTHCTPQAQADYVINSILAC
jgi:hypothetical protein